MSPKAESDVSLPAGWRAGLGLAAVFALAQPFLYWAAYAGDAIIHLIFAENAARGAFYEFNPGEISSGVTSSGFLLWLAVLFRSLPSDLVPVAAKLSGIAAWYAAAALLFGLARERLRSTGWAAVACLVFLAMPGSTFNSSVGMETSFFVALSVGWLWWATRRDWFSGAPGLAAELGIGALLGAGFWLRPEAALIGACGFGLRGVEALRRDTVARVAPGLLLSALAALGVAASALAFHHAWTGEWLPTSGRARVFIAQVVSPTFGPLLLDPAFAIRLAAYAPISVFFFAALPALWRRHDAPATAEDALGLGDAGRFSALLFGAGFALYTFITGAHHLARYIAFLMPGFALIAVAAARHLHANWDALAPAFALRHRSAAFAAIAVSLAALYGVEAAERFQRTVLSEHEWIGGLTGLAGARSAPAQRERDSDEWIERLGDPRERPIVIAMQEVQLRYELDDRFVVRSLDGRVDAALFDYATPDDVDHIGYLKHRGVHFVFDAPHYVADPRKWSIAHLRRLAPGESSEHDGLRFTRLREAPVWRVETASGAERRAPQTRSERRRRRLQRQLLEGDPR